MDTSTKSSPSSAGGPLPRAHRLVRRLTSLYASCALAVGALLCVALLPAQLLPQARALALEAIRGGVAGMVLAALLLALSALLAVLALTAARSAADSPDYGRDATTAARVQRWLADPGVAARQAQALILPAGAALIIVVTRALWPASPTASDATAANIAGAFVFALAFISLLAERLMNAFPAPQLPEAPAVRRVLLLVTLVLTAAACIEFGRAAGLEWVRWPEGVVACAPGLVVLELALRALARMFLPPPLSDEARAVSDSLLAGLITGGPRSPHNLLRTHFGLDFARSWALQFLSSALLPALLGTGILCWALSGLKLIELGQRGVYERLGAPVAVLGPGLHVLLPWPLGRLRPVEYGTIHSVAIGVDQSAPQSEAAPSAEAAPPLSLNRLWESTHADQADYLVPSPGTGQQGFQSVSTEIYVLYRVGLSDTSALQSIYAVADPESLVKEAASRLVLRYFNSRTLDAVLGARRENVAGMLREELAADIDSRHAGIEIVSFLIEEVHPPAGAAEAYHAVQAAEINASASISDETGRAKRVAGVAQQEAHNLITATTAQAAETLEAARAAAYRFDMDRHAYDEAGRSFLLERSYSNLESALRRAPLTIIDHRLSAADGPFIDLRAWPAGAAAAPNSTPPAGAAAPTPTPTAPEE